jgi:hypothetical protein
MLTTHPLLVPRSQKGRANLYPPSGPVQACNGTALVLHDIIFQQTKLCAENIKVHDEII